MRTMQNGNTKLNVIEHIMLKNFWEYYIIDDKENSQDVKLAYVLGFENEIGCVSMEEIQPYIMSKTDNLNQVLPAPGFAWVS